MKLQIDTGATCNNISYKDTVNLPGTVQLTKSPYILQPYGNSSHVKPVGQVELICARDTRFYTLLFQVLPDDVMKGKPALLSGSNSVHLRIVNVNADEVFQLCNHVDQIHSGAPNRCAPNLQPSKSVLIPSHRNLPAPGKLRRTDLLNQYHALFQGLIC